MRRAFWSASRTKLRTLVLAVLVCCLCVRLPAQDQERPNVLLIVTDDQRPDTIRALGNPAIRTPHLDRLVSEGTTFTRAITACPICVASRAELLTGRNGLTNGNNDWGFSPQTGVPSWAEVMRNGGYDTCYIGKWHTRGRPSTHGYVRTEGLFAGGGGRFPLTHPHDWKGMDVSGYRGWVFQTDNRQLFPERGIGLTPDISEAFADAAIGYLQSHVTSADAKPFFLHVNFTAPHDPLWYPTGLEKLYDPGRIPLPANFAPQHPFDHGNLHGRDELLFQMPRTPSETRRGLAVYYAVISHLDEQVGRLVSTLESRRLDHNTLVIFTSDHGLAMGSHGLRGKQNMYEHTVGVPLIMRGPGIKGRRRTSAQCYLRDLFPTVCELAGLPIPDTVQGRSLKPVLDEDADQVYDAVFAYFRDVQRMVRQDEWKYVVYPQAEREQLFDLSADPRELTDLAGDPRYAAILASLKELLTTWRQGCNDPTLKQ